MRYIVPTTITDGMLVSSSIAETDHAAWSAGAAYSVGNRVIRASTHSIFERLIAGTTATAPEDDAVNWVRVGPTNRWAAFDGAVGTSSSAASSLSFSVAPGVVRGLAMLDIDIEGAVVTMTVDGDVVYTRVISPAAAQEDCEDWYTFFFGSIQRRSSIILNDLPPYGEGVIHVTLTGQGTVSIGAFVVGPVYELGDTLSQPRVGIVDYSRKVTDEFGATTVVQRAYSRRMTVEVVLPTSAVDLAVSRLARVRAQPVVWVASDRFDALAVYGWLKDWDVAIPGLVKSTCSLQIEGLT